MRWLLALGLFLLSCARPYRLGEHPVDRLMLKDSPETDYLSEAYGMDLSTQLLLHRHQSPSKTPDPSALFAKRLEESHALEPISSGVNLSVLTFNAGLLETPSFQYPYVENRREALAKEVFGKADIICMQEVWRIEDAEALRTEAAQYGYVAYGGEKSSHSKHGLMTFIRADIVNYSQLIVEDIYWYKAGRSKNAALIWQIHHRQSGQSLIIVNTQAEQQIDLSYIRNQQARELGLLLRERQQDQVVLLGGDLAAGVYFPNDSFEQANGVVSSGWALQSETYPLWLLYSELKDVWNEVGIPKDVILGEQWPTIPDLNSAEFSVYCSAIMPYLTLHDCNPGHRLLASGMRYPARSHHIMFAGSPQALQVQSVEVAFEKSIPLPGSIVAPLGIHSGVLANFEMAVIQ